MITFNCKRYVPDDGLKIFGKLEDNIHYTFSGKTAITLALRYYRAKRMLHDKTDAILVPMWMGTHVYMTIHKYCQTTPQYYDGNIRGVYVYHQYGFPQKMGVIMDFCLKYDLFVIEDCAHAFESYIGNERLGTIGHSAIFSLAKFFPCTVGGALFTYSDDMRSFASIISNSDHDKKLAQKAYAHRILFDREPDDEELATGLEMYYSVYDRCGPIPQESVDVVRNEIAMGAIDRRQHIYVSYCDELDIPFEENVLPWAVPVLRELSHGKYSKINPKVVEALKEVGVDAGIYHFDVNRNLLEPNYQRCLLLPCHQGVDDNALDKIIEIVGDGT